MKSEGKHYTKDAWCIRKKKSIAYIELKQKLYCWIKCFISRSLQYFDHQVLCPNIILEKND